MLMVMERGFQVPVNGIGSKKIISGNITVQEQDRI